MSRRHEETKYGYGVPSVVPAHEKVSLIKKPSGRYITALEKARRLVPIRGEVVESLPFNVAYEGNAIGESDDGWDYFVQDGFANAKKEDAKYFQRAREEYE